MGCAKSKEALDAYSPDTAASTPFPVANETKVERTIIKKDKKRTTPSQAVPLAKKSDFKLNSTLDDGPEDIKLANTHMFYALIQQKARSPGDFVLYDTQPKSKYGAGCLKFALNPWKGIPEKDVESDQIVAQMMEKINGDIKGRKVLLYGNETCFDQDLSLMLFLTKILKNCSIDPQNVIVLSGPFLGLCREFPNCYSNNDVPLPGPTEILYQPNTGFCLYMSEVRTLKSNLEAVREVAEIGCVVNCSEISFKGTAVGNAFIGVEEGFREGSASRGQVMMKAVERVFEFSRKGVPVLVCDNSGEHLAPAVCAWAMVELGWTPEETITHIMSMRGPAKKYGSLNDERVVLSLNVLHRELPKGIETARQMASEVFPLFDDDDNAFDS